MYGIYYLFNIKKINRQKSEIWSQCIEEEAERKNERFPGAIPSSIFHVK